LDPYERKTFDQDYSGDFRGANQPPAILMVRSSIHRKRQRASETLFIMSEVNETLGMSGCVETVWKEIRRDKSCETVPVIPSCVSLFVMLSFLNHTCSIFFGYSGFVILQLWSELIKTSLNQSKGNYPFTVPFYLFLCFALN
jgi:hypothetical protein